LTNRGSGWQRQRRKVEHVFVKEMALCFIRIVGVVGMFGSAERGDQGGAELTTWPDGSPRKKSEFYYDDDGVRILHGVQTEWFENGKKQMEATYVDGRLEGMLTAWYNNGQRRHEGKWKNNRKDGVWTEWHMGEEKASEAFYVEGKIVGKRRFWMDGRKRAEEEYDAEGALARTTWWYDNGQKEGEGSFKNGEKHGVWTYWTIDGHVEAEGEWRDGKPWEGVCSVASRAPGFSGVESFVRFHKGDATGK